MEKFENTSLNQRTALFLPRLFDHHISYGVLYIKRLVIEEHVSDLSQDSFKHNSYKPRDLITIS